jgi:hypothetical protein
VPVPVTTRAQKYLSNSKHYTPIDNSSSWREAVSLSDAETLIGVYQNEIGQQNGSIIISTKGIHLFSDGGLRFIAYDDIRTVDFAFHDKHQMLTDPSKRVLLTHLKDGRTIPLQITGMRERGGADVASFLSFLGGALQSLRIEQRRVKEQKSSEE